MPLLLMLVMQPESTRLLSLRPVDVTIILLYFAGISGHWFLSQALYSNRRRLFYGRATDDCMGRRPEFSFRQSRIAGIDGVGGGGLSVRHSRYTLVLDWRNSRNALSGNRDDAFLLHFQNTFSTGISEAAFWRAFTRSLCHQLWSHDRAHERREYLLYGAG